MTTEGPPDAPAARLVEALNKPVRELGVERPTGVRGWLQVRRRRVEHKLYERGVETKECVAGIDHFHPDRVTYQPSGWRYLRRALRRRDVGPDDVFLDLGSGKGRVLCVAARYPFARVIGVEIAADLNAVARANLDRVRRRCRDVELVTADAVEYEIPDDVTVVYLYHPFVGDTFRRVMGNLVASLDRAPRELRLIYALPTLAAEVEATGRFRLLRTSRGGIRDAEVRVYSGR
jgi:SAM-dependent methyltransferase